MKNLNMILALCITALLCFTAPSCKKVTNFLEKPPGVDINEDLIFSSKAQLELFITATYRYGIHSIVPYKESSLLPSGIGSVNSTYSNTEDFTENGESQQNFSNANKFWNVANILPNTILDSEDARYYTRWIAIRYVNIILERIKEVPGLDQTYIDQVTGEVKTLRAMNYFEMVKRYGGMPIVNKRFQVGEQINVPRSSFDDCIKFIVADCDDAIAKLPNSYPSNFTGRVTKGVALAIKSKTLLFAASPLFNSATPYIPEAAGNKLVGYGSYDVNRWKTAADAAQDALTWALNNGYGLINDKGNDKNYKYAWETPDNKEILLAEQFRSPQNANNYPWGANWPIGMGPNAGYWDAVEITQTFVKKYEKTDGTPQTWDPNGGTDLTAKYNQLDLRFKQTVGYNQSYWNVDNPVVETFAGGKNSAGLITGAWFKKLVPDALRAANGAPNIQPAFPLYRVNELYLNLAEALNEYGGPLTVAANGTLNAFDAINTIRRRSGMPEVGGLDQTAMRAKIRNERDLELVGEDHHFWDLRRWLAADKDGVMRGSIEGIKITKVGTLFNWVPYIFETRTFLPKEYLYPLPFNEVQKGNLAQNPGWQ